MDKRLVYGGLAILGVLAFFIFRRRSETLSRQGMVQAAALKPLPTTVVEPSAAASGAQAPTVGTQAPANTPSAAAPPPPPPPTRATPPAVRRPPPRGARTVDAPVASGTQRKPPDAVASTQPQTQNQGPAQVTLSPTMFFRPPN